MGDKGNRERKSKISLLDDEIRDVSTVELFLPACLADGAEIRGGILAA
jgi:hypothetical protein